MEIYVLGIKLKNLLFVFALIISIIIMGNYFQQGMEVYIENNFLRWGIGISLSISILYMLFDTISDFYKEETTHNELKSENAQNEFNLLDEQNSEYSSTSNSVFRLHFSHPNEPTYIDGWLVIDENMDDQTGRAMMGYIPVDTTTGAPTFIPAYRVDSYDYLYEKSKPKLTVFDACTKKEELMGSQLSTEKEWDITNPLDKEIDDEHSIIQKECGYAEQLTTDNYNYPSVELALIILGGYNLNRYRRDEIAILSLLLLFVGCTHAVESRWRPLDDAILALSLLDSVDSLEKFSEKFNSVREFKTTQ